MTKQATIQFKVGKTSFVRLSRTEQNRDDSMADCKLNELSLVLKYPNNTTVNGDG